MIKGESNIPIISNYTAELSKDPKNIIKSLKNQMSSRVRWTDSIKALEGTDINDIIEIGPGKVLSALIFRITKKFAIRSVDKIEDLEKFKSN